uniref:Integral membrane protein GPR137C isoform X1 n=1 Tax=Pogona vitticeps TaxID=103695 RepID=A0A6J0V629_9SAUR
MVALQGGSGAPGGGTPPPPSPSPSSASSSSSSSSSSVPSSAASPSSPSSPCSSSPSPGPASPGLELGLSLGQALLYAAAFLVAYLQLWLLLWGQRGEKRLGYRSVGLFLGLLWAALRTVLFACYLQRALQPGAPIPPALRLPPFPRWLLACFPVCLLFATACLLNLYFAEVIFKVKCVAEFNRYKALLYMGSISTSLLFIFVNLTCALLAQDEVPEDQLTWAVFTQAVVNDSLFILCAVLLACSMYKLSRMSSANVYLESKGTSVCQAVSVGSVVVLLYSSRAFYNLVAVAISPEHMFNYGWDSLSDKGQGEKASSEEYVVFGVVLFLWEFIPTMFVVLFFRAQRLSQNLAPAGMINSHSYNSRAYFFDNPRRYDSDDDLPRLCGGSLTTPQSSGWYGSLTGSDGCGMIPPLVAPPMDVTPLLFTHGSLEARNLNSRLMLQNSS